MWLLSLQPLPATLHRRWAGRICSSCCRKRELLLLELPLCFGLLRLLGCLLPPAPLLLLLAVALLLLPS
jgi:hypothetical protein